MIRSNSRSPLYGRSKAVVEACEKHLGLPWDDTIGHAVAALRGELHEIDNALTTLDELRTVTDVFRP
jgi:hypothetical protein